MKTPRILVVEDERIIAFHLRQQLTKLGYDVPNTVATGDHALRHIEESRPDLILMDINLKGHLDGIATVAAIPPAYRIPVIYLTAYSEDATLERAAATHPHGFLLKPYSERELHAMIQVTLARSRSERAGHTGEERRQQVRKMAALSQLAGGLAEEVNDLLAVLYGQLEVLGVHAIGEQALAEPIQDVFNEAIEKERLIQRLLDFSDRRPPRPTVVSVNDLIATMAGQFRYLMGDAIQVLSRLPDGVWRARIDAGQLARALSDLAVNAREAMAGGGTLTIESQNVTLEEDDPNGSGRYVLLSVADTGSGMPESVLERAFEPFFTTWPASRGRGLGLSLVFSFAQKSGGHISIDSKPGNGTTVRLYLPAVRDGDEAAWDEKVPDPSLRSGPNGDAAAEGWPDIISAPVAASWRPRGGVHVRHAAATARDDGFSPVLWRKAENALFATVQVAGDQVRYRLVVEPLPRRNGWDWTVWRPNDSDDASRHGHASSAVSAMAAAEDAARQWDRTTMSDD